MKLNWAAALCVVGMVSGPAWGLQEEHIGGGCGGSGSSAMAPAPSRQSPLSSPNVPSGRSLGFHVAQSVVGNILNGAHPGISSVSSTKPRFPVFQGGVTDVGALVNGLTRAMVHNSSEYDPTRVGTYQYPDGSTVENYKDGTTIDRRPNGEVIIIKPDGTTIREWPDGVISEEYRDGTWQAYAPDGSSVWHWRIGEGHEKGEVASKSSVWGWHGFTGQKTLVDGTRVTFTPEGRKVTRRPDGSERIEYPDGVVIEQSADGTTVTTWPDGSNVTTSPDGTMRKE